MFLLLYLACAPILPADEARSPSAARVDLPAELVEKGSLAGHAKEAGLGRDWRVADVTGDAEADLVVYVQQDGTSAPDHPGIWVLPGPLLGDAGRADVRVVFGPYAGPLYGVGAGDLDGDGIADLWTHSWAGAWLIPGPLTADLDLSTEPMSALGERCGIAAEPLGDLDGDGALELQMGCPEGGSVLSRPAAGRPLAESVSATTTAQLLGLGDIDGDGLDDLAWSAQSIGVAHAPFGSVVDETAADATILTPALFVSLAPAGDVDGDGAADLIASAWVRDRARSYVLVGPFAGDVPVTDAIATIEFAYGVMPLYGRGLGDVDGDGFVDVGGSDPSWPHSTNPDFPDEESAGAGWLAAGPLGGAMQAVDWVKGHGDNDRAGHVRSAGDLDGDGLPEIGFADPAWRELLYEGGAVRFFGVQ